MLSPHFAAQKIERLNVVNQRIEVKVFKYALGAAVQRAALGLSARRIACLAVRTSWSKRLTSYGKNPPP